MASCGRRQVGIQNEEILGVEKHRLTRWHV